jgi:hypothetical protein
MASRFSYLAHLIQSAKEADAERPKSREERERERAQSRQDIRDGRRMFLEQQSKQAAETDPEAAYLAHCKAQALKIINAGRAVRGQAPLERLMQDESPEYPDQFHTPDRDSPDQGDDSPNPPNKGKKKTVKKKIEDQSDDEDAEEPVDEGGDDFDSDDEKKKRDKAIALQIINAGRRRDGLPLLTLRDML